jgi:hypothetical protein
MAVVEAPTAAAIEDVVGDDRKQITADDRVVLIIEDDLDFAQTELAVARGRGFKGIVATRGDHGVALAHEFGPTRSSSTWPSRSPTAGRCSTT